MLSYCPISSQCANSSGPSYVDVVSTSGVRWSSTPTSRLDHEGDRPIVESVEFTWQEVGSRIVVRRRSGASCY